MAISVDNLSSEISAVLLEYSQDIADGTKRAVDEVAKEATKELKKTSPVLTGDYKKGWTNKVAFESSRTKRTTVYNRTNYQITHLLEYGHASRLGGRVKPAVHIKPVEEKAVTELMKKIERVTAGK